MSKVLSTGIVLTVSEGKRLIAKAIAAHPAIKTKIRKGMIVIAKGTTNSYVVEELLGKKINLMAYGSGVFRPKKNADKPKSKKKMKALPDIVLQNGKVKTGLDRFNATENFQTGDIYIKGANALDYKNRKAGVMIGAANGGTIGTVIGDVIGKRGHLMLPVGLEKIVYEDIDVLHRKLQNSASDTWRMFPVCGEIITEIEALNILTGVQATLAGAGGIAGAEGCTAIYLEGSKTVLDKTGKLLDKIYGEPRILDVV